MGGRVGANRRGSPGARALWGTHVCPGRGGANARPDTAAAREATEGGVRGGHAARAPPVWPGCGGRAPTWADTVPEAGAPERTAEPRACERPSRAPGQPASAPWTEPGRRPCCRPSGEPHPPAPCPLGLRRGQSCRTHTPGPGRPLPCPPGAHGTARLPGEASQMTLSSTRPPPLVLTVPKARTRTPGPQPQLPLPPLAPGRLSLFRGNPWNGRPPHADTLAARPGCILHVDRIQSVNSEARGR